MVKAEKIFKVLKVIHPTDTLLQSTCLGQSVDGHISHVHNLGEDGRWSLEDNIVEENGSSLTPPIANGHSEPHTPNDNDESANGSTNRINSDTDSVVPLSNNLVEEKHNLNGDEKSLRLYLKFPAKVNNNVYDEKGSLKDGMNDYFRLNSSELGDNIHQSSSLHSSSSSNKKLLNNGFPNIPDHINGTISDTNSYSDRINGTLSNTNSYPDHMNALNGEEEDDDDGCIYTYKGERYDENLSHLLNTCLSCGLPNPERCRSNGFATAFHPYGDNLGCHYLPRPGNVPQQNNLFSPEMDFLEMDFDPGVNGDGELESNCEDNCVLDCDIRLSYRNDTSNNSLNDGHLPSSLNGGDRDLPSSSNGGDKPGDNKRSNLSSEMRHLMCHRCESSVSDAKVENNVDNVNKSKLVLNLEKNSYSCLDDRPNSKEKLLFNVPTNNDGIDKDMNVKISNTLKQFENSERNSEQNGVQAESVDYYDGDSVENNLDEEECLQDFSDEGDEADDERDDSNSEQLCLEVNSDLKASSNLENLSFKPNSFSDVKICNNTGTFKTDNSLESKCINLNKSVNKLHKCCLFTTVASTSNYNSSDHNTNNNLGSTSAPEVSPAREYSPLEKFSRSLSFHNQLSSPKYENFCFTAKQKNYDNATCEEVDAKNKSCGSCSTCNIPNTSNKSHHMQDKTADIEACVHRLNSREKTVFNILSDTLSNSQYQTMKNRHICEHKNIKSLLLSFNYCSIHGEVQNNTADHVNTSPIQSPLSSHNNFSPNLLLSPNRTCNYPPTIICPPLKSLDCKMEDPSHDPNTASDEDGLPYNSECIESPSAVKKTMIWTEPQATLRQVLQIGTSACGATAVVNALFALEQTISVEKIAGTIQTRLRAENAPLVEYLFSRSVAGSTHKDLVSSIEQITEGSVTAKFFHMFPKRAVQLSRWLAQWIQCGGVPIATLNLQIGTVPGQTIPDAWHHQMIYGVGPQGVYLTNPLECVSDSLLADQLCSDSILLIRRANIVSRWNGEESLVKLMQHSDSRWKGMNVLGEVIGVLKEEAAPPMLQGRRHLTSHVAVPAAYKSGITICMRTDNPKISRLRQSQDLPLLE